MNKYTFVLFAFFVGALALQAQSYQTSFTYEDAPDSLKNSVFSKDGKALFDSLYIFPGVTWKEYFKIHHTSTGRYTQNDDQKLYATYSTGRDTFTYLDNNGNEKMITEYSYVGKYPAYYNTDSKWGVNGNPGEFDNLFMYNTSSDGFLKDNKRKESANRYYGYHILYRECSITARQTRKVPIKEKCTRKVFGICIQYSYSKDDDKDPIESTITYDTTYVYKYNSTSGRDDGTSEYVSLPPDEEKVYPTISEMEAELQKKNWSGYGNYGSASEEAYDNNGGNYDEQRVYTRKVTEKIHTWAGWIDGDAPTLNDKCNGVQLTSNTIVNYDPSTGMIEGHSDGVLSRIVYTDVFDTVAQVRHHIYLVTPNSLDMGFYSEEDMLDYYDTTFYDLSYSWTGEHYVSSNPAAPYHEFDSQGVETGQFKQFYQTTTETVNNGTLCGPVYVYKKGVDGISYSHARTFDYSAHCVGEIQNKKVYITGEATTLYTNPGIALGWMQPINSDVYLENVRLQSKEISTTISTYDKDLDFETVKKTPGGFKDLAQIIASSAVFYLKQDSARIHFRGNNYLGGQLAGKFSFRVNVKDIKIEILGSGGTITEDVTHIVPKYSSPIEICEGLEDERQQEPVVCILDDIWIDGSCTHGYLDLSTALSKNYTFSHQTTPYYNGMRYGMPLYTGGNHGTFIINSGHVNMWPANAYAADVQKGPVTKFGVTVSVMDGHTSNYLICGSSAYSITFDGSKWSVEGGGLLESIVKSAIYAIMASVKVDGVGNGVPEGKLIINGGTVTTETDTMSFGYRYTQYEKINNVNTLVYKTANNIDNEQPMFAANVEINGGSFRNAIYNVSKHSTDSAWNRAVTYEAVVNTPNQTLVRTECLLPAPNTDYSHWQEDTLKLNREGSERMIVVNPFEDNQYIYGFTGVKSDAQSKGYFYLPSDNWKWSKNFFAKPSQPIESYEGYLPYNLTVEAGGIVKEASDTRLLGTPRYVRTFTDNEYVALCMPFDVVGISDAYGDMDAYVELADNPSADNSNAYFYMYHMRDESGEARTTGINESFRRNYHTHAAGNYMEQGRTYLVKFPNTTGESYWSTAPVTFRGEAMDTVKGSATFALPTEPTLDTTFVMGGNATFAEKALSGNYYVVDAATFGDDDFHVKSGPILAPCEGFLLGNQPTMDRFRSLGARPRPQENTPDEGTTTDHDIVEAEQGYLAVYAAEGAIHVLAEYDTEAYIYTVAGQYITTLTLQAHQPQSVSVPQGVYLVRSNEEVKKAVVD